MTIQRYTSAIIAVRAEVDGLFAAASEARVETAVGVQSCHRKVIARIGLTVVGLAGENDPTLTIYRDAIGGIVRRTEVHGLFTGAIEARVETAIGVQSSHRKIIACIRLTVVGLTGQNDPTLTIYCHASNHIAGRTEVDDGFPAIAEGRVQAAVGVQPGHCKVIARIRLTVVDLPGENDPTLTVYRHARSHIAGRTEVDGDFPAVAEARVQAAVCIVAHHGKVIARGPLIGVAGYHNLTVGLHRLGKIVARRAEAEIAGDLTARAEGRIKGAGG